MRRFDEPRDRFDLDLFRTGNADLQIEGLYRIRRSAHEAITVFGKAVYGANLEATGGLTAPPAIHELPAAQQPEALAEDEAARVADAHLYALDEEATAAAVQLGAELPGFEPGPFERLASRRFLAEAFDPPAPSGLLRWASGVGYTCVGTPVIACHWGPSPGGTWVAWWADNRAATRADVHSGVINEHQAKEHLRMVGPLMFTELGVLLQFAAVPLSEPPAGPLPSQVEIAQHIALTATLAASWALLRVPEAARVITRAPTANQAAQDRRRGLTPCPATLASAPIDLGPVRRLPRIT